MGKIDKELEILILKVLAKSDEFYMAIYIMLWTKKKNVG